MDLFSYISQIVPKGRDLNIVVITFRSKIKPESARFENNIHGQKADRIMKYLKWNLTQWRKTSKKYTKTAIGVY